MKKDTLFDAIDAIDNEIVEEALSLEGKLRAEILRQRRRRITTLSAIAACLALVIVITPIASWIKGIGGPDKGMELPIPTVPGFMVSLPSSNVYTDPNEIQQREIDWYGRQMTLNYQSSYDVWYTDAEFSTYEMDGEQGGSITFIKGTDTVHRISTRMNMSSRGIFTEESIRSKAKEIVETYSTIDTDSMFYSCTSNMMEESEEDTVDSFISDPLVESYTVEYVQKLPVGYTSCHATVTFGIDGSVEVEMFNEDTADITRHAASIKQSEIYDAIEKAVSEYRSSNPELDSVSCDVDERITLIKADGGIHAVTRVKLFNEADSDEYILRVTLKTVDHTFNSGSVDLPKVEAVSLDEILRMIGELEEIYRTSDSIRLEHLDYFYYYYKSCIDEFEANAQLPLDKLFDTVVPRTGMTYRELKTILSAGIIYETVPQFKEGNFSGVSMPYYLMNYEAVISAMLIDRLYGMLPAGSVSFRADYNVYGKTDCYVRIMISDDEYENCTFDITFVVSASDSMEISSILYSINRESGWTVKHVTPFEDIRANIK